MLRDTWFWMGLVMLELGLLIMVAAELYVRAAW
jgi:hypothetical protein